MVDAYWGEERSVIVMTYRKCEYEYEKEFLRGVPSAP